MIELFLDLKIKICFLKEIGISEQFVLRKSSKIVKIEMMWSKRHLPIFLNCWIWGSFYWKIMAIWSQDTKNVKKSAYVVEWIRSLILIKRREKHLLPIKSICDIVGGRPLQYLQGGMYRAVEKYHAFHRQKYHSNISPYVVCNGSS